MILCNADKLSRRFNLFKKAVKEGLNDFMQGTDKSESKNNKLRFFKIKSAITPTFTGTITRFQLQLTG